MSKRAGRQRSQALVEFALAMPLFMLLVFSVIQLSLVFVAYYSETRMARETARWLAVRSRTAIDKGAPDLNSGSLTDHVRSTMLPGLINGPPTVVTAGTSSVDAVYTVGNMRVTWSPCEWNGTICTHLTRAAGNTLYVQMNYDVSNLLFLPTTFRFGSLAVKIPTALPPYKVSVMVE